MKKKIENFLIGVALIAITGAIFYFSVNIWNKTKDFLAIAKTADGIIIDLQKDGWGDNIKYYPKIAFTTINGKEIIFTEKKEASDELINKYLGRESTDRVKISIQSIKINGYGYEKEKGYGAKTVLYNPKKPQKTATSENGFQMYLNSIILFFVGLIMLLVSYGYLFGKNISKIEASKINQEAQEKIKSFFDKISKDKKDL